MAAGKKRTGKGRPHVFRLLAAAGMAIVIGLGAGAFPQPAAPAAADAEFETEAGQLRDWGLFLGTSRGFELDREPTRSEAIVMLIRLLGKEDEANGNPSYRHPFTDVPAWADRAVAYAWHHGLTTGVSADRFGSGLPVTAEQYCTFVLRALGYDDQNGDFEWREAPGFIEQLGLGAKVRYGDGEHGGRFLRGHVVDISYHALFLKMKDRDVTLFGKLEEEGAIADFASGGEAVETEPPGEIGEPAADGGITVPVKVAPYEYDPNYLAIQVSADRLRELLPGVRYESGSRNLPPGYSPGQQLEILLLENWTKPQPNRAFAIGGEWSYVFHPDKVNELDVRVFYDDGGNPVAYTTIADLSADRTTLTFHTQLPGHVRAKVEHAREIAANAVFIPHDALYVAALEYVVDYENGEPVTAIDKVVEIDRSRLPEANRHFAKRSQTGFYLGANGGGVTLADIADMTAFIQGAQQNLMASNLMGMDLTFDYYPLQLDQYSGGWSLMFDWFLNEDGEILAYTYFTDADYRAWADRVNQWSD